MDDKISYKGKVVLIVEDDHTNFLYLSQLLRIKDAIVIRSTNGLDAFFDSMSNLIDLVIMDIRLPKLNGIEAIRLIKKYQPNLPIIVVTASITKEDKSQSEEAGADAFFMKPILPSELLPVVNYYIGNVPSKNQLYRALN